MITEIGIVAGEIWHFLDRNDTVTLDELVKGLNRPEELVFMSPGWLAREGHVLVEPQKIGYKVSLRNDSIQDE